MFKSVLHYLRTAGERFTSRAESNAAPGLPPLKPCNATYRVYTKEFDLVVDGNLLPGSEHIRGSTSGINPYAMLDLVAFERNADLLRANCSAMSSRLTQTLTSEQRHDTAITILFDHSGSLRAHAIYLAVAEVAEALADSLTSANIATEILGFTTRRWKGGKAREKWLNEGSPPLPGRLNDLLHIVYLDGSLGPRPGPHRFPAMRDERLFKENIDGEALEWASKRLLANTRPRKILIVVSDGAPVDDATLTHSWSTILSDHVEEVANRIASTTNIILGGIGIEHRVHRYYPNDTVTTIDQLSHIVPDFVERMNVLAHQSPIPTSRC